MRFRPLIADELYSMDNNETFEYLKKIALEKNPKMSNSEVIESNIIFFETQLEHPDSIAKDPKTKVKHIVWIKKTLQYLKKKKGEEEILTPNEVAKILAIKTQYGESFKDGNLPKGTARKYSLEIRGDDKSKKINELYNNYKRNFGPWDYKVRTDLRRILPYFLKIDEDHKAYDFVADLIEKDNNS